MSTSPNDIYLTKDLVVELHDTRIPALTAARDALVKDLCDAEVRLSRALRKFDFALRRWGAAPTPTNTDGVTQASSDAADIIEQMPAAASERATARAAINRFDEAAHTARMLRVFHIDTMRHLRAH